MTFVFDLGGAGPEEYWRREDCWKTCLAALDLEGRAASRRGETVEAVVRGMALVKVRAAVAVAMATRMSGGRCDMKVFGGRDGRDLGASGQRYMKERVSQKGEGQRDENEG